MRSKKLVALLLTAVLLLMLAACAPTDKETDPTAPVDTTAPADDPPLTEPQEPEKTKGPEEAIKVAILLPGSINDNGWCAAGYAGLKHLESMGVETAYTENVAPSDQVEYLLGYVDLGFKIIIAHGSQFIDAVRQVAIEHTDTIFLISNPDVDNSIEPNVACFGAAESGYLAGIVAGAITETGVVVGLAGEETISFTADMNFYKQGAELVNPDVEVHINYIGTLTDADKGKEVALSYITQHDADVMYACCNAAGLGVLQAAEEQGVYAIGMNQDQYDANPDAVVVSVLRNFSVMFENLYEMVKDGTFEAKLYRFGLKEGGTVLSDWHGWDEKLPAEAIAKIQQTLDDIESGKIVIPD